eukprot:153139_1
MDTFGDIHQYTTFKFKYESSAITANVHASLLTMWHYFVMVRYDGNSTEFLDDIYSAVNGLYDGIMINKDIFEIIVTFCEYTGWEKFNSNSKQNILSRLYATNEAHKSREFAYCVLENQRNKWYAAANDSLENRSPILLFEFVLPVSILEYSLRSAGDCPHRDPYQWILFGVFGDEIKSQNKIVILDEYNGDSEQNTREKPWKYNGRWKWEIFKVQKYKQQCRFKFIGLEIIRGRKNMFDIQLGQIKFKTKL